MRPPGRSGTNADDTTVDARGQDETIPTSSATVSDRGGARKARIGPYPILGDLGGGGMGHVYLGFDPRLERNIAIKVLTESLASDPVFLTQFRREAKLLASLNNPNIATIYSLEADGDSQFLTMEMIEGQTLADRLAGRPLPTDEWLSVARQIAVALEAAHRHGIVHLDLKPRNVMVTKEGVVKVLDFGLAMSVGRDAKEAEDVRTRSGTQEQIGGTPGYMSPEQTIGESIDSRTDIWAFGCILYECVTGCPVFPGTTPEERIRATLEATPDWGAIAERAPERIHNLLQLCLTRDLDFRLDTIAKARREIEEEIALRSQPVLAPRALERPNNLPAHLGGFIGREVQKAEVKRHVADSRLVTLTGVGGGGKTRLAIEVGREILTRFPDGVWLVELASLASPDLVPDAVAAALKLKTQSRLHPMEILTEHLRRKTLLLILDNCERLITATAELAASLLESCPGLRVLATSREELGMAGEVTYHVPSMAVPGPGTETKLETLSKVESVRLFSTRAVAGNPAFELTEGNAPSVAQICRRLDGIPLAIELAAARIKVLPAEEIASRLNDRFRLLGSRRTGLPHQKTLRALIDWSYDQLPPREQLLCRRLSLFAGGWTLDAAESVCSADGIDDWEVLDLLSRLIDKSLVEKDIEGAGTSGKPRYRMLETIREYAHDRLLERKEGSGTLVKLRGYFLALAEENDPRLTGPDQGKALARLSVEDDNLRLALDLCADPNADPEIAWRMSGALGRYWFLRGKWYEGRKAFAEILTRPEPREGAAAAEMLNWAGNLAKLQGDIGQARTCLEEALAIRRRLAEPVGLARALNNLGNVLKGQGALGEARVLYEESLAIQRKLGNQSGIALALYSVGALALQQRDLASARTLCEESLALNRKLGDRTGIAAALNSLGQIAQSLGDPPKAMEYLDECLALYREIGDRWGIAGCLNNLGAIAEAAGDLPRARACYEEGLADARELGNLAGVAISLNNLGVVLTREGDHARAGQVLRESLAILRSLNDLASIPALLDSIATLAAQEGDPARAARILAAAEAHRTKAGRKPENDEERRLEAVRERLKRAHEAEWAAGAALTLEEAIDFALAGHAT